MAVAIQRDVILGYSAQQMVDLVNDVAAYPEFVPYCQGSEVLLDSSEVIEARLMLAKGVMTQSFATRNTLQATDDGGYHIEMALLDGALRNFNGSWTFHALDTQACKVSLAVSFELMSGLGSFALKPLFDKAATQLVDAFCNRAKQIYG
ncbi:MAG: type II toxin-antitoxin system RatA family toxin [Pseudomonadota bacterium]